MTKGSCSLVHRPPPSSGVHGVLWMSGVLPSDKARGWLFKMGARPCYQSQDNQYWIHEKEKPTQSGREWVWAGSVFSSSGVRTSGQNECLSYATFCSWEASAKFNSSRSWRSFMSISYSIALISLHMTNSKVTAHPNDGTRCKLDTVDTLALIFSARLMPPDWLSVWIQGQSSFTREGM